MEQVQFGLELFFGRRFGKVAHFEGRGKGSGLGKGKGVGGVDCRQGVLRMKEIEDREGIGKFRSFSNR